MRRFAVSWTVREAYVMNIDEFMKRSLQINKILGQLETN